ncbi:MAG: hypothetical protein HN377_09730 [Alphaproteobacteria bacterium]|jgi:hypothetical protein|nr:hypothetical protein [Alphaproteobacteria bacterium]MBT7943892.1 hypothetical protein [Alphaproteobacteria bacterium]
MDYTERQVLGGNDLQHKQDSDRFIPAGQRSEVLAERRVEEDRRIAQACSDVYEEPTNSERRDTNDRRTIMYGVTCYTSGPIDKVEDWLDENCEGEWRVVLLGVGEDLIRKKLKVMFKTEADRAKFDAHFCKADAKS